MPCVAGDIYATNNSERVRSSEGELAGEEGGGQTKDVSRAHKKASGRGWETPGGIPISALSEGVCEGRYIVLFRCCEHHHYENCLIITTNIISVRLQWW